MSKQISIIVDGQKITTQEGLSLTEVARIENFFIPTLCDFKGLTPAGTCRVCSVKVDGRIVTGCTIKVTDGMVIENSSEEITALRQALIEMLFVEGNHMCPTCEKSGNCELQALAYHYRITAPRFPYLFPKRKMESVHQFLMLEHNRCIQCRRCVRGIKTEDGKHLFAFNNRGGNIELVLDQTKADQINRELAAEASEICPVGAIIFKGQGFETPIGGRKFDNKAIGDRYE